jgi:hypothetical protein
LYQLLYLANDKTTDATGPSVIPNHLTHTVDGMRILLCTTFLLALLSEAAPSAQPVEQSTKTDTMAQRGNRNTVPKWAIGMTAIQPLILTVIGGLAFLSRKARKRGALTQVAMAKWKRDEIDAW